MVVKEKLMDQYCINENYTIHEAMAAIDSSHTRCVLVLSDEQKVVGVVSQGDIVRALVAGTSLYANISNIMNRSFIYLQEPNIDKALKVVLKKHISLLPILDDEYHLIDVITVNDIFSYLSDNWGKDE